MTDRPTIDDLDAAPDDGPWCCTGNAEDCALCAQQGFDMLAYPWICPDHERTAANERIVREAGQAAQAPKPWTQLEARAFNAVLPALREAGEWLPLTARRKVARAVLAEILGPIQAGTDAATWTEVRAIQLMNEAGRERDEARAALERVRELADDAEYGTYTVDVDTLRSVLPAPPADTLPGTAKEKP